jgi:hypothetical protein
MVSDVKSSRRFREKAVREPLPSGIGKPGVKRKPHGRQWTMPENADFPAKLPMPGRQDRPPKRTPGQDAASLTHRERPRFNRFSNHRLHSEALTPIHDMQVQPL